MTPPNNRSFEWEIKTEQQADSIVEELNEEERKMLLDALNKQMWTKKDMKETKEIFTKSLEFEKETFRISSEWWEEVTKETAKKNSALKKFLDKWIRVKANITWDVVEYMEDKINGNLKCKKWEQIFITYDAFISEVKKAKNCTQEEAEKKYLMTIDELQEKMKDKPSGSEAYKKFFNEEVNGSLAGYWDPTNKPFSYIGVRSHVWLVGGNTAYFSQHIWNWNYHNRYFGFSGRLLKN